MPQARIAIVEDSPVMQAILTDAVQGAGFVIAWTGQNGLEAVEKYRAARPDAVIMDIVMPTMNGIDALDAIIKEDPGARVVMASSISDARTVVQCLHKGARRYVVKPYSGSDIVKTLETVLAETAGSAS